jgi:enoyl-CoA hydratase
MTINYSPGVVSHLELARPERRNAIDALTAKQLREAIQDFTADEGSNVLIISGAGGFFCAGADLSDTQALGEQDHAGSGPLGFSLLDAGKPVIAAIEGPCVAGGMELAAWCDIRIAANDAYFGAFNRRWGVPFIDGGTWRFVAHMGLGNALYLIETGAKLSAEHAQRIGFVQEVVEPGQALPRASEHAARIAEYPQLSLRADRAAALDGFGRDRLDALNREAESGRPTLADPKMVEGLQRFNTGDRPEPPEAH